MRVRWHELSCVFSRVTQWICCAKRFRWQCEFDSFRKEKLVEPRLGRFASYVTSAAQMNGKSEQPGSQNGPKSKRKTAIPCITKVVGHIVRGISWVLVHD
jgi:hypothetical protein